MLRHFEADDACKHLCILTDATKPSPFSALCSQIHRRLAVLVPSSHLWVHCPRASNGLLPRRSYLCLMSRLIKFSRVKHHKGKSARFRVR
jgi:hypothetical protein